MKYLPLMHRLEGRDCLIIGGGSPQATLWAVYEFVERAGVRFLLEKDVLPEQPLGAYFLAGVSFAF